MRLREIVWPHSSADDKASGSPFPESVWRVTVLALHAIFAVLLILTALDVAESGDQVPHGRALGLGAVAVIAIAYLFAGQVALYREAIGHAVGYLVVLVLGLGVLAWTTPDALFILFIAFPQVWFLVERPAPGVVWTVLLFVTTSAGVIGHEWYQAGAHPVFGDLAGEIIGLVVSLALGLWVTRVLDQNSHQATLIAELERAQAALAAAHHERGVLAERERLARDVHDTLAQGYTSIVLLAQTAAAAADPAVKEDRLMLIEEVARDNLREARALIGALSPVDLDGTTLRGALAHLADRFGRETGLAVVAHLDADTSGLHRSDEVVLLRAVQEALSNARRHARATSVELWLEPTVDGVAVRIDDDGIGFAPDAQDGTGLDGLRRRLAQAGGSLDVQSTPGGGTRVVARVVTARAMT